MSRPGNDILISALLVLLLAWVVWEARDWPLRTRLFPWAIGFPVLALALAQLAHCCWTVIRHRSMHGGGGQADEKTEATVAIDSTSARRRALSISIWTIAFALGFWLLGFKVGSLLLSPGFLRFQARESWKLSLVYGVAVYLFFLVGFEMVLRVPLPPGALATWLELQSFDWYLINLFLSILM